MSDAEHEGGRGASTWSAATYRRLIMEGDDFRVIIDNDSEIDWETKSSYGWEKLDKKDVTNFDQLINKAARLECICDYLNSSEDFKRLIAEAIARGLDHDLSAASSMLDIAEVEIEKRLRDHARARYQFTCLCFSVPMIAILVIWIWRSYWQANIGHMAFWTILATSSGALGALFSVFMRASEPKCTPTAQPWVHIVEAASRILGGAIAGGLMAIAVRSGWLLEPISKGSYADGTTVIAAFAAGYLERLAPMLVKQIEGRVHGERDNGDQQNGAGKPRGGRRRTGSLGDTAPAG